MKITLFKCQLDSETGSPAILQSKSLGVCPVEVADGPRVVIGSTLMTGSASTPWQQTNTAACRSSPSRPRNSQPPAGQRQRSQPEPGSSYVLKVFSHHQKVDPITIVSLHCLVVMETSLNRLKLVLPPTARFQLCTAISQELWSPPATQMFSTVPMPTVTGGEVLTLGGETGRPIPDGDQRVNYSQLPSFCFLRQISGARTEDDC